MRRKLVDADLVECVLGLGPNLFYNSPMEGCIVVCRASKPKARKGKVLFVNAVGEVTRERGQSFLTDEHLARIVSTYRAFKPVPGFAHVATLDEIRARDANLSLPLYVSAGASAGSEEAGPDLGQALEAWLQSSAAVRSSLAGILSDK